MLIWRKSIFTAITQDACKTCTQCAHLIQQAQEMRSLGVGIGAIRVQVLYREFTGGSLRVRRSSGGLWNHACASTFAHSFQWRFITLTNWCNSSAHRPQCRSSLSRWLEEWPVGHSRLSVGRITENGRLVILVLTLTSDQLGRQGAVRPVSPRDL